MAKAHRSVEDASQILKFGQFSSVRIDILDEIQQRTVATLENIFLYHATHRCFTPILMPNEVPTLIKSLQAIMDFHLLEMQKPSYLLEFGQP